MSRSLDYAKLNKPSRNYEALIVRRYGSWARFRERVREARAMYPIGSWWRELLERFRR